MCLVGVVACREDIVILPNGTVPGSAWWPLIRKLPIHTGTSHYMKLGRALLMHAENQNKKNRKLFIRFYFLC